MANTKGQDRRGAQILGIILVLAGGVFLLTNFDVFELDSVWRHWPLVLIVVGLLKLFTARSVSDVGPAAWWIFIGAWLYASVFQMFGLGFSRSWPILIIGWGISVLWSAFTRKQHHVW